MGKANRIRNDRYSASYAAVKTPKKKQGMPTWALNLITILVTAVILFSVVFMMMVNNGVFGRMSTAMKSENFRISRNMMNYYFQTQYQSLMSNESYGISSMINQNVSLKEQYIDTTEGAEVSWFDYIMAQTEMQVEELLVFCEEAKARGIELDDADLDAIDEQLHEFEHMQATYDYVGDVYGKGMKVKDLRAAMKIQALAQKCTNVIGEELEATITDEDILARYEEDPSKYQSVDYYNYEITVDIEDAIIAALGKDYEEEDLETDENKAKIVEEYKKLIADAKAKAAELSKIEDADKFKSEIITLKVTELWDDKYEVPEDMEDADVPAEADVATIRDLAIKYIVGCVIDEATAADKFVVEGKIEGAAEITEKYADLITSAVSSVFTSAKTAAKSMTAEKIAYSDTDDIITWAFDADAKDTKTFEEGDGADEAEISENFDELKDFSVTVVYLTKAAYPDETVTKNVALMVFSDITKATAALDKLANGMSVDEFKAIAEEYEGSFTDYVNYSEGSLGNTDFDAWLFAEDTEKGSILDTVISLDTSTYLLALYYEDGLLQWEVSVKSAIFSDIYTEAQTEITAKYQDSIVKNEKSIGKIDA